MSKFDWPFITFKRIGQMRWANWLYKLFGKKK